MEQKVVRTILTDHQARIRISRITVNMMNLGTRWQWLAERLLRPQPVNLSCRRTAIPLDVDTSMVIADKSLRLSFHRSLSTIRSFRNRCWLSAATFAELDKLVNSHLRTTFLGWSGAGAC